MSALKDPLMPMKKILALIIVLAVLVPAGYASGGGLKEKFGTDVIALRSDYENFYLDTSNLLRIGAGMAAGGVLANTSADREFQEFYGDHIGSDFTNNVSKKLKLPGEPLIAVPLLAGARLIFPADSSAGLWAGRTLRGVFLGGPAVYLAGAFTGGGRPEEGEDSSGWRGPFHNNNGASGHTFIGAMPFITAAMMQENIYLKAALYAASPLAGLSRINDDKHYLSQVVIGWYLAYLSARTVDRAGKSGGVIVSALPAGNDGIMVLFTGRF